MKDELEKALSDEFSFMRRGLSARPCLKNTVSWSK